MAIQTSIREKLEKARDNVLSALSIDKFYEFSERTFRIDPKESQIISATKIKALADGEEGYQYCKTCIPDKVLSGEVEMAVGRHAGVDFGGSSIKGTIIRVENQGGENVIAETLAVPTADYKQITDYINANGFGDPTIENCTKAYIEGFLNPFLEKHEIDKKDILGLGTSWSNRGEADVRSDSNSYSIFQRLTGVFKGSNAHAKGEPWTKKDANGNFLYIKENQDLDKSINGTFKECGYTPIGKIILNDVPATQAIASFAYGIKCLLAFVFSSGDNSTSSRNGMTVNLESGAQTLIATNLLSHAEHYKIRERETLAVEEILGLNWLVPDFNKMIRSYGNPNNPNFIPELERLANYLSQTEINPIRSTDFAELVNGVDDFSFDFAGRLHPGEIVALQTLGNEIIDRAADAAALLAIASIERFVHENPSIKEFNAAVDAAMRHYDPFFLKFYNNIEKAYPDIKINFVLLNDIKDIGSNPSFGGACAAASVVTLHNDTKNS